MADFKFPKYIINAFQAIENCAEKAHKSNLLITNFFDKNNINSDDLLGNTEKTDDDDFMQNEVFAYISNGECGDKETFDCAIKEMEETIDYNIKCGRYKNHKGE